MSMKTGYLRYERIDGTVLGEEERTGNFQEFHLRLPEKQRREQAQRCMNCGVPFCQNGTMISGMASGCPLHNLVPEINGLVACGRLEEAHWCKYQISRQHPCYCHCKHQAPGGG